MHRYQPKSDFGYTTFEKATLMPVMIGEVISITRGADRYRMLCQGIAETRTLNYSVLKKKQGTIVVMAVYVTDQLVAERYLLFPREKHDRHVSPRSGVRHIRLSLATRSTSSARISI